MDTTSDECIPIDPRLCRGNLPNGVQYFVYPYDRPKDVLELRLIVKVGSLMENEEQQGYAHFIEHLGFKGTETYDGYELVKVLESLGIVYGADLNASTHLLETTYRLTVSKDSDYSQLLLGLRILYEWAFRMRISDSDVAEERHVIYAEYLAKKGLSERLVTKYWSALFDDGVSLLARRKPIGIPEVFMQATAEQLRNFYSEWYTPPNMAVVVVGDCSNDIEKIVSMMNEIFVCDDRVYYESPQVALTFPSHGEDVILPLVDTELTYAQLCFEHFAPIVPSSSVAFYRQEIGQRLLTSIIDNRLNMLCKSHRLLPPDFLPFAQSNTTPFLSAGISTREFIRGLRCTGLTVTLKNIGSIIDTLPTALRILLTELLRIDLHGFREAELIMAKAKWRKFFAVQRDHCTITSASIASEISQYVLHQEQLMFAGSAVEAELALHIIDNMTADDVLAIARQLNMHQSAVRNTQPGVFRVLCCQLPHSQMVTEEQLRVMLNEARCQVKTCANILAPWPEPSLLRENSIIAAAKSVLVPTSPCICVELCGDIKQNTSCRCCSLQMATPPQALAAPAHMPSVDAYEVALPNGITVCFKYLPKSASGQISFQAFALGGSTELSEVQEAAMCMLDTVASNSSLILNAETSITARDMQVLQSLTQTRVNTQRHTHHRGLGGSCPADKLELLLAMLVLKLTSQCIDEEAFTDILHQNISSLEHRDNSPEFIFMERARILTCGDVPITRPYSRAVLDAVTIDIARDLYQRAFMANPTEFTFVFTGDLPPVDAVVGLLHEYLGSLQPKNADGWYQPTVTAPVSPYPAVFPSTSIYECIKLRASENASSLLVFRVNMPLDPHDDFERMTALMISCRVLQTVLLDKLRVRLGKVYNVTVDYSRNSLCDFALVSVILHCEPDDLALIKSTIDECLDVLRLQPADSSIVGGIVEAIVKQHRLALENSSYWLFWLLDSYKSYRIMLWHAQRASETLVSSSKFAETLCGTVSIGKETLIKSVMTPEYLMQFISEWFSMEKCVHLDLCPLQQQHEP